MKKSSLELKDEKSQLKDKAIRMLETCKKEIRKFTDDEQKEYDSIKQKIETINDELRSIEESLNKNKKNIINNMPKNTKFSLVKAIRNVANNVAQDEVSAAVLNEGANEMRKAGLNWTGQIQLPIGEERAAITVSTEGEDLVATDIMDIVKPLQAKNVMLNAGARFVSGLVGDVQYPVMGNGSCTWENEDAEAGEAGIAFTNVKLSPKRLTTQCAISKQLLVQDSVGVEAAVRAEIINAINSKIEATILGNGAGSPTEPKGLFPNEGDSGLTSITDFKTLTEMESDMEEANVYGELKYLLSPKAKAALRGMAKGTKSTQLVYENGEVDGTPALSTSNLKNNHVAYGDFSQYIVASWGNGIDLTVDTVTLASKGQIRLIINSYWDMKPLRDEAIKVAKVGA